MTGFLALLGREIRLALRHPADTLAAVLFIQEQIEKKGYTLSTMGEQAKRFIANWESEKYRKSLLGAKA